jgi:hypothetical protein
MQGARRSNFPARKDSGPHDSSALKSSSALNQVNDQEDDGNYQQEVDQTAANVAEEAKKPEHDQDDNYSPEHGYSFRLS